MVLPHSANKIGATRSKLKVKLSLCLNKQHAMKTSLN